MRCKAQLPAWGLWAEAPLAGLRCQLLVHRSLPQALPLLRTPAPYSSWCPTNCSQLTQAADRTGGVGASPAATWSSATSASPRGGRQSTGESLSRKIPLYKGQKCHLSVRAKALKDGHSSHIVGQLPIFQEEEEGTFARVILPKWPRSSITCAARTGEPPLRAATAAGQAGTAPRSEEEKCDPLNRGLIRLNYVWFPVGDAGNGVGKDHMRVRRSTLMFAPNDPECCVTAPGF